MDTNDYTSAITENLLNMAQKLGIKTIAEGVETVGEWRCMVDHGARTCPRGKNVRAFVWFWS